eukprot:1050246-Pelagomonas_calceolata.AAC.7
MFIADCAPFGQEGGLRNVSGAAGGKEKCSSWYRRADGAEKESVRQGEQELRSMWWWRVCFSRGLEDTWLSCLRRGWQKNNVAAGGNRGAGEVSQEPRETRHVLTVALHTTLLIQPSALRLKLRVVEFSNRSGNVSAVVPAMSAIL